MTLPDLPITPELFDPGQLAWSCWRTERCVAAPISAGRCPALDVIYINAIAWVGDSYEVHGNEFRLTRDLPYKAEAIVPASAGPGPELSTCLDDTPHNWYFSQARGAVFLRMALLTCMVDRAERVMDVI